MAVFVLDASVCLAWCFEDEFTEWTNDLFTRLPAGDRILVPAHWLTEVFNGLLSGVRRQRIKPAQPALFWDEFANLPIVTEPALTAAEAKAVLTLGEKHSLTFYDAPAWNSPCGNSYHLEHWTPTCVEPQTTKA
jgi:predicted nucleic acid-binding protein